MSVAGSECVNIVCQSHAWLPKAFPACASAVHLPQTGQLPPFLRGFTGLISDVVNEYFTNYFPAAVATATSLVARNGTERLIYTTHSWLVSLYLDCPASGGFNIS